MNTIIIVLAATQILQVVAIWWLIKRGDIQEDTIEMLIEIVGKQVVEGKVKP
jgi:hypothetical protein